MPLFRPRTHSNSYAGLFPNIGWHGNPMWMDFDAGEPQGCWVFTDGRFVKTNLERDDAFREYGPGNVYEVGRDGYYLTMAQARTAIEDGAKGVHYVDDYNDEFQDFFICEGGLEDPKPYLEAHKPAPIA